MMIKLDPWKRIDKDEPFCEPEDVYLFAGSVSLPGDRDKLKFEEPRHYSSDKIKNAKLLKNTVNNLQQYVLSIQYSNCLITSSLNTKKYVVQSETPDMVPRHQVRGDADEVFYIKDFGDRDKVIKLQLHD